MQMNNLEAWDIIRKKYKEGYRGVFEFNDPGQYIMSDSTGLTDEVMVRGEFSPRELWAIGWYLAAPEDFDYLKDWDEEAQEENDIKVILD